MNVFKKGVETSVNFSGKELDEIGAAHNFSELNTEEISTVFDLFGDYFNVRGSLVQEEGK